MDNLTNSEDAKEFLTLLGIRIDEGAVQQVIDVLSGKTRKSLYSLYTAREGRSAPTCGKGTAYKIKKLYDGDKLGPYLQYVSQQQGVGKESAPNVGSKEITTTSEEVRPPTITPGIPPINLGDLMIAPALTGAKLIGVGPPMFPPQPPVPAYADISIRLNVDNRSDTDITVSDISYEATINESYAGKGSAPVVYTILPHHNIDIASAFRADFATSGNVVISAILSGNLEIEIMGTAYYSSNSGNATKAFSGVISVILDLPFKFR